MKEKILVLFVALVMPVLANAQDGPNRRIVFNDDAQVLMECPATGTSKFIKDWLDRELATPPFNSYVFQSASTRFGLLAGTEPASASIDRRQRASGPTHRVRTSASSRIRRAPMWSGDEAEMISEGQQVTQSQS